MASTDPPLLSYRNRYHVLLSYKGQDINNNFIEKLSSTLHQNGFNTFKDDDRLGGRRSSVTAEVFKKAMEESLVAIVIFSKNYASSIQCLDQLVSILSYENKTFIPVYHGVNASDVRNQQGNFGNVFFDPKNKTDERNLWRNALVRAAAIPGLQLSEGKEEITINEIMQMISSSGHIFTYPSLDGNSLDSHSYKREGKNNDEDNKIGATTGEKSSEAARSYSSSSVLSLSVFLSFQGEDIRKSFVDHLFSALQDNGVFSLMGDESHFRSQSPAKKSIAARLSEAIGVSRYAIVFLTKDYISSPWCMRQLVKIMECKTVSQQIVFPVYYGLTPQQVRNHAISPSFSKAFSDCNINEVELWEKSLLEVTMLVRLVMTDSTRLEETVAEIVEVVLSKLEFHEHIDQKEKKIVPENVNFPAETITGLEELSGMEEECVLSRTYDVFISFRGEDVRKGFVDHLYSALDKRGLYPFKDDKKLKRGESIAPSLTKAIKESSIAIVVFTQNYADSSWCLDELLTIMNCSRTMNQIVLPVFYDVSPSEVRKLDGHFGKAFAKHSSRDTQAWRKALAEAASISGWEPKNTANGHEAQCISKIVDHVSEQLRRMDSSVEHEKLVGIRDRVNKMKSLLEIGVSDVRMIGICGIGGGGKTTVARALFNEISRTDQFDGKCFVENVREHLQNSRITYLQKKILSMVDKKIKVDDDEDGTQMIKKRLGRKKVFIVLDDVDDRAQLEKLAGRADWFGKGSRIIITTRDESILNAEDEKKIHSVDLLDDSEAIQLFSRYAFGRTSPKKGYAEHSRRVVEYAHGLPLTLTVLGGFLHGREKPEWDGTLERLAKIPDKRTMDVLRISYDGLEDEYKEVFLHIACFFRGWNIENVSRILHSCEFHPGIALGVLKEKSLITNVNNCLGMHDRIQEMGRDIVQQKHPNEAGRHSLLWSPDKFWTTLENDEATDEIKAIVVDKMVRKDAPDIRHAFRKMKKLRLLHINTFTMKIQGPENLPDGLRWLTWKYYDQKTLPESFQANQLVGLELPESGIEQLQTGKKGLGRLKFLNLSNSKLIKTPDFGSIPYLESLELRNCSNLKEVHPSLRVHKTLVSLNLNGCDGIESLPSPMEMKSLKTLHISKCSKLKKLPEFSREMDSLQELISSDNEIKELPQSIGNLSNLVHLDVNYCRYLIKIPSSICSLKHLEVLDLSDCTSLKELPENLDDLYTAKLRHVLRAGSGVQKSSSSK